jgi:hypothetical protein
VNLERSRFLYFAGVEGTTKDVETVVEQNHDEWLTFALTSMVLPASPDVSMTASELLDWIVPADADQMILPTSSGSEAACSRNIDREQSASLMGLLSLSLKA